MPVTYLKKKQNKNQEKQTKHSISDVFNVTAYIQAIGSNIILHSIYSCAALSNTSVVTSHWLLKQFSISFPCHYSLLVHLPSLKRGQLLHYSLVCCMSVLVLQSREVLSGKSSSLCHYVFSNEECLFQFLFFAEWIAALFCFGFYLFWLAHHSYRSLQDSFITPCSLVISHNHYLHHHYWFFRTLFLQVISVSFMKVHSMSFVTPFLFFCSLVT